MGGGEERAASILRYLASCYRENGSRVGLSHLDASRVHGHLFLKGEDELVSSSTLDGQIFVPGGKAASLATKGLLYEKDRDLVYGTVFLAGKWEGESNSKTRRDTVFAPLLLYPVSVSQVMDDEGGAEFLIDTSQTTLNYALIEQLGDDEFVTRIEEVVEGSGHTELCVSELSRVLQEYLPNLDVELFQGYPKLLEESVLKRYLKEKSEEVDSSLFLASGAVLFLAEKSTEMRGVLNDLEELSENPERLSDPLRALFDLPLNEDATKENLFLGHLPAILSPAQDAILKSSKTFPITLAVGPPGTGKSYTIASLAIEAMSRGESVLIVSKMDHAVDVVADKIEQSLDLDGVCVRAGRKSYLRELKSFLENLLGGMYSRSEITRKVMVKEGKELEQLKRRVQRLEQALESRCKVAEKTGEMLSLPDPGWFTRWRQKRIRKQAESDRLSLDVASQMGRLLDEQLFRTVTYLKNVRTYYLQNSLAVFRPTFQAFSKGIRARTSHKKEEYFKGVDWSGLFTALPVWLSKVSDLHRVLPLKQELFDLVIVDEASQCDIASALPAMARAKRAVVTGDPKQLRHISFLPLSRQKEFAIHEGLSEEDEVTFHFRRVSLVDLLSDRISDQRQVHFLNEHFRSRPEIIAFSNAAFYDGRLAIMTGHREIDRHGGKALLRFEIGGRRSATGVNQTEVDEVMRQMLALANSKPYLSIGILSPFRAQVEAIQKQVENHPMAMSLLEENDLLVGTAHSFQGEERDVMFLSLALDADSPSASYRFVEREDVFNVAITRARLENRVFTSFAAPRNGTGILGRYLTSIEEFTRGEGDDGAIRGRSGTDHCMLSSATRELLNTLEELGLAIQPNFEIGGYRVDLLCSFQQTSLGIDVIGFPGSESEALTYERHLALRRAGIPLLPIGLAEWLTQREKILEKIRERMGLRNSESVREADEFGGPR